ncbi:TIR domain-containing protein [Spirosoma sp. HMF4905]|uniref:TIR domain-containing protein n=2 Tax=Spirosoma arboris TaxID=2682092 RepID=A0A7K1SM45_9BACT|nr:TIR domain-containing protein [Spirosoma arboris]
MDLRRAEIDAWIDTRCLLPGQNWKKEIPTIIQNSKLFIALISKYSLNKRGYIQREIKYALEVLKEVPSHDIYFIPVRLDESIPYDEGLLNLNWVDLYPSYSEGLRRILTSLTNLNKKPLEFLSPVKSILSEENSLIIENPNDHKYLTFGTRHAINYTPYRKFSDYVKDFIEKLPKSAIYSGLNYLYYITLLTKSEAVVLPPFLLEKYPNNIVLVLQHRYTNLKTEKDYFTVDLWFDNSRHNLKITYESIIQIVVPTIGLNIEKVI